MFHLQKNEGALDRLVRAYAAIGLLIAGLFWTPVPWNIVLLVLAAIALFTAMTGFCALYVPLKFSTSKDGANPKSAIVGLAVAVLLTAGAAGSYYSDFFTRKVFLEDFNRMNQPYKQTLFETGQGRRAESVTNYEELVVEHKAFRGKYLSYRPFTMRGDGRFVADMDAVAAIIATVEPGIRSGDLAATHKDLEAIRPIYQDLLKRNGFSMLAVYLVDFHDAMEKVLGAANAKDPAGVVAAYAEADARMKAVEETADDDEIRAIRASLEAVSDAAKNGQADALPGLGSRLKSDFVKVYLKRG